MKIPAGYAEFESAQTYEGQGKSNRIFDILPFPLALKGDKMLKIEAFGYHSDFKLGPNWIHAYLHRK